MSKKFLRICAAMFLLYSNCALAAGDLWFDPENGRCMLKFGPTILQVIVSRPLPTKTICENLPGTGIYRTSFALVPKVKNLDLEFRVLRNVGQSDDNENIAENTEYFMHPQRYRGELATFEHDYKNKGDYIGILRARGNQGKYFVEYIARFPFSVGADAENRGSLATEKNSNAKQQHGFSASDDPALAQSKLPPCPTDHNARYDNCYGSSIESNGKKYVGEWKNGTQYGPGIATWPDGAKYDGNWKNGKLDGFGTYSWKDGRKYVGQFKDGKRDGRGTETWPDGEEYVGQYKDDKWEGYGTYRFSDGDEEVGEFKGGKLHGKATYTWHDGRKYVGGYENDERSGRGILYAADGSIKEQGVWEKGRLVQRDKVLNDDKSLHQIDEATILNSDGPPKTPSNGNERPLRCEVTYRSFQAGTVESPRWDPINPIRCTVIVDSLTMKNAEVNRGNCPINGGVSKMMSQMTNGLFGAMSNIFNRQWKFGETFEIPGSWECKNPIEWKIWTGDGKVYSWQR